MKCIKILLADPRHSTVGAHSNFIPINIGYIGSNLLEQFKENNIDLKLCTDSSEIFELLEDWKPDVIGVSNYIWNSELSNLMCKQAKKNNSNVLTVMGGPEFPAGTGSRKIENSILDQTYDKCFNYLLDRPSVDYFAYSDGEVVFLELVKIFIENNLSLTSMKNKDEPMKGCASLSNDKKKLLVGAYMPRIGMEGSVKAKGRDVIPSPYTTGLLDKFLDGTFVPTFETARGCPFLCTFCDQGLDESKITTFSVQRLTEEMTYVAEKISKLNNTTKVVNIVDSNWGIFEKDVELADNISEIMDKYDWPQYIECNVPKSNWNNLLKINDRLKNRVNLCLSMQSLNVETLGDIKRRNWTAKQYIEFINECKKRGKASGSEIIIPLPKETEKSYFEGVKFLMENNIQARTWTLMMLCGAELGRDKAINDFNMKSKYRLLPKQFGKYCGEKVFEIEKICVSTNTMDHESYLRCRNYSFVVKLLGHAVFVPIEKLTKKLGISWYDFSKKITDVLQDKNFKGEFKNLYNEFCQESQNELFNSSEEAIAYYSKPENYEAVLRGDIGENLLSKYTVKGLLILDDILTTIFHVLRNNFSNNDNELNTILSSSEKWLKNLYILDAIFDEEVSKRYDRHELKIDFDFPEWLSKSSLPFTKFKKNSTYELKYDIKKINYIRREIKSFGNDKKRAFGRYLDRRAGTGFNFFEKTIEKLN